jgi:ABC-type antimicrobial peptide transport system permease subunit
MYRLGLQLTLKGGREAFMRLLLTIVAVAVGVTVLFAVFADFHAYQATSNRPAWEATSGVPPTSQNMQTASALLWNYSENIYKGQFIEQLDVAAFGSHAPVLPGITKLPGAGEFYASPALARLLQTVPKDELGNRFPGREIGTIGQAALSFPTELAIYVGYNPQQLATLPNTVVVNRIANAPQLQGTANIYKDAFVIGAIAILFPLLILINTATRLAAARREERYAAMRLVGATPRQINVVASVDAIVGSFIGVLAGIILFLLVRPAIADISFSGVKFFSNTVFPPVGAFIGMILVIPFISAIASLISLRRVQVSPLGVSRKTSAPKPGVWRLAPLVIGVVVFITATHHISNKNGSSLPPLLLGMLLTMAGLALSGSWLTMQITRLFAQFARSAPVLLATRRLSDNPKAAFRSVSGLTLAVFVGTLISVIVPAINTAQSPTNKNSLSTVLRVPYSVNFAGQGLPATQATELIRKLQTFAGTTTIPIYVNPQYLAFMQAQINASGPKGVGDSRDTRTFMVNRASSPPNDSIISCANLKELSVLGTCPAGATAVTFNSDDVLSGDNPLSIYKALPVITTNNPSTDVTVGSLELAGLLIKTNNADTLEQVRTYLTTYNSTIQLAAGDGDSALRSWQMGTLEPETVNEVAEIRNNDDTNVERVVLGMVALTLITAGCSLAVTVGGSLVERKRPFTLLRVSGTPLSTLYKVVLFEAALPLIVVSIVAAGVGFGVGIPTVRSVMKSLAPSMNYPIHPGLSYYVALGAGLIISLGLVAVTLPLLKHMTKPEDARFE